jgi:hypothetical protein
MLGSLHAWVGRINKVHNYEKNKKLYKETTP